jgi:hypothetical protein
MRIKHCKNCGVDKPITEFYLSKEGWPAPKCKECHKAFQRERRIILLKDPSWVEKEKDRTRRKIKKKIYNPEQRAKSGLLYIQRYPEKYEAKKAVQRLKASIKGNEVHHWSYNKEHHKDTIELSPKDHKKAHRFIVYDQERMMYRRFDTNELLNTKDSHEEFILDCIRNKPN